jgi:hypothetical protein
MRQKFKTQMSTDKKIQMTTDYKQRRGLEVVSSLYSLPAGRQVYSLLATYK